ncbi:hypothetical protein BR93DRAFT_927038, partial [Coniochaeta sp. PMI_546]
MAPLILHNVPDDELYVGDDGIQRPYAMVFPHQDEHTSSKRSRRAAAESGSFGKSSRRSRSKTATPARREDPTIAAADKVFSSWIQNQAQTSSTSPDDTTTRKVSSSQPSDDNSASVPATRFAPAQKEPTEVILRGYRSALQQYAAIDRFEQVAGRICEDYPRDPPIEQRRYKSELRDPAYTRRRALTPEERAKVNKADGGEHWVKVTFESAEAADLAISASPLSILGHMVYAEPYHGIPPTRDEAILDASIGDLMDDRLRSPSHNGPRRQSHAKNSSFSGRRGLRAMELDTSPISSRTADSATITSASETATLSSATSSATITGGVTVATTTGSDALEKQAQSEFCRTIPTARKVRLLPAEQALLPQQSLTQRLLNMIPFLRWFSGSMIGNEVPRTETGEFDWDRASLYWKLICWLDLYFALFGGEILNADKD